VGRIIAVGIKDVVSCTGAFRDAGGHPLVVDGAYIRQWIHMRYKACNFKRYMSESDMSVSVWSALSPRMPKHLLYQCCRTAHHSQMQLRS